MSAMKPADAAFLTRWELARRGGRWRYMLISGALTWGVPMFFVMTFLAAPPPEYSISYISFAAAIWFLGGLLYGALVWFVSERRYARLSAIASHGGPVA